jgi:hypothetical protein
VSVGLGIVLLALGRCLSGHDVFPNLLSIAIVSTNRVVAEIDVKPFTNHLLTSYRLEIGIGILAFFHHIETSNTRVETVLPMCPMLLDGEKSGPAPNLICRHPWQQIAAPY